MNETGIEETAVVKAQAASTITNVVLREAEALEISSDADFQGAAVTLREIKSRWRDLEDERKRILKPLDDSRARIMELFRLPQDYLTRAERVLKDKIGAWTEAQERRRREAEAQAAEIARKEAERLQKKADRALAAGHIEQAAALEGAADNVVAAEVPPPPKAYGTYTRETWSAVVEDELALIQAVAAGTVPAVAIQVNMAYLNQRARADKDELRIPGVRAVKETSISASTGIRDQRALPRR